MQYPPLSPSSCSKALLRAFFRSFISASAFHWTYSGNNLHLRMHLRPPSVQPVIPLVPCLSKWIGSKWPRHIFSGSAQPATSHCPPYSILVACLRLIFCLCAFGLPDVAFSFSAATCAGFCSDLFLCRCWCTFCKSIVSHAWRDSHTAWRNKSSGHGLSGVRKPPSLCASSAENPCAGFCGQECAASCRRTLRWASCVASALSAGWSLFRAAGAAPAPRGARGGGGHAPAPRRLGSRWALGGGRGKKILISLCNPKAAHENTHS